MIDDCRRRHHALSDGTHPKGNGRKSIKSEMAVGEECQLERETEFKMSNLKLRQSVGLPLKQ